MIRKELYDDKMRKAFLFVGQRVTNEAANVIYDEIKDGYQDRDFINAIEDVMQSDSYKITGPTLVRRLNLHKSERIEREHNERKEEERQAIIRVWDESGFDEICQNHKCGSCDKTRCDEMARATIAHIKDILFFEPDITLSTEEQIEQKKVYRMARREVLIKDFPGAGFEKEFPRQDYISLAESQGKKSYYPTRKLTVVEQPKPRADIDADFPEERL